MKCFSAFSSLPDILYLWTDHEFEAHLIQLAIKNQLTEPDVSSYDEEQLQSFAGHFFYPLVTSNKYMKEHGHDYESIKSENGFLFVMGEVDDMFFVAVNGDDSESELYLRRKINFFSRLLSLNYGPCAGTHLKSQFLILRKHAWEKLTSELETWQLLCQQEQMFLVEALERLHVNAQLNTISLGLLHEVLAKTNRDGHTVHALLLVNNKLLGLYSNEKCPELKVADILMLIMIAKNRFHYHDDTVPKSNNRTPPMFAAKSQLQNDKRLFKKTNRSKGVPVSRNSIDNTSVLSSSSLQEYHSASSTPSRAVAEGESFQTPDLSILNTPDLTTLDDTEQGDDVLNNGGTFDLKMSSADLELVETSSGSNSQEDEQEFHEDEILTPMQEDSDTVHAPIEDKPLENNISDYFQQCVFLNNDVCEYSPHTIHCLLLHETTVLIIISQNRYIGMATILQELLNGFCNVMKLDRSKVSSARIKLLADIEKNVNKVALFSNKNIESLTEKLQQVLRAFQKSWNKVTEAGLREFVDSELSVEAMDQRLENHIEMIIKNTKEIFNSMFISTSQRRMSRYEKQLKIILNVRDIAKQRFSHLSEYLSVKGKRNVTMTAYHNDYPGLVHFVYINRNIDQLIAPTINVNSESRSSASKVPIYAIIKQYLWDFWQYAEHIVTDGYTSVVIKNGDFNYSYFIWFEDFQGNKLTCNRSLKDIKCKPPTGIVSGSFYKNIIRYLFPSYPVNTVHCYELLCVHVGLVTNDFVVTSCKRLAQFLWESTGEAHSPINLL